MHASSGDVVYEVQHETVGPRVAHTSIRRSPYSQMSNGNEKGKKKCLLRLRHLFRGSPRATTLDSGTNGTHARRQSESDSGYPLSALSKLASHESAIREDGRSTDHVYLEIFRFYKTLHEAKDVIPR